LEKEPDIQPGAFESDIVNATARCAKFLGFPFFIGETICSESVKDLNKIFPFLYARV
jgi:hypothetical protein